LDKKQTCLRKLLLRSWVQLPPGPFITVRKVRHYFELDFDNCRTNSAAMPMAFLALIASMIEQIRTIAA
jgi:hypothetical protein